MDRDTEEWPGEDNMKMNNMQQTMGVDPGAGDKEIDIALMHQNLSSVPKTVDDPKMIRKQSLHWLTLKWLIRSYGVNDVKDMV